MSVQTHQNVSVGLTRVDCGRCGGVYAITDRFHQECRDHKRSWTCPYCKTGWGFNHDGSPLDQAKQEAANEKARREEAERRAASAVGQAKRERSRADGYKGAMRKARKRVANGVCPCCTRTFKDLAAHMATKHPEYSDA